ncbi:DUF1579 domain-containing protein [Chitinophaga horti]|uniref:DUF1579 domain-containing protein n=1 Tax=Chitinophaga horti TaxID=2920382 RepID=A0ABY6J654_9BACT|nr:DUF1579 domain-containing protein [Chitinophaga horti]UYQ93761.1 DUF1579 domain-containing protein [Chitinophaga horti]
MKRNSYLLAIVCLLLSFSANAQDAAAQKAWEAYMTPGEMHKMLASADGNWKYTMSMWMAPGAEPMKSEGSCMNRMILGGRYQESTFKGDFMGMPFEGVSITGFDNAKKTFHSNWIDNMGTGIMNSEGKWDDAAKAVILTGKSLDPATGKEMTTKTSMKVIDDNNHLMEMFMVDNGQEFKTMELKLVRAK